MKPSSLTFRKNAEHALLDTQLQRALDKAGSGFIDKRHAAMAALPEFEQLRHTAREIKEHTLSHLDEYLLRFEQQVVNNGGQVHWASTSKQATDRIVELCREANARKVTKGKTMVGEEVGLNEALQQAGISPIETDLGEYIIQLADEPPSHIIAPAIHKTREQITALFKQHHARYGLTQPLETVPAIVNEARQVLRQEFIQADVGITGANLLIADTGSTVLVTNEGNGDLTASLPRVHIVIASIEKVVPTLEDATVILRLLARSATGQEITSYTSFFTGPKRETDVDGPEQFHVVLVDNGRTGMLGNEYHSMLRCIHCGACLNHCPVYSAIGGHAYGWVYPGPMGAVLTPLMIGLQQAPDLPQASTLCGRCAEVCPMSIPLPDLLRQHRFKLIQQHAVKLKPRLALASWGFLAIRPRLYRWVMNIMTRVLKWASRGRGRLHNVPFAGGWTQSRDLPAPQGETFIAAWQRQHVRRSADNE
jgi:L-lactate dehydrogenase complex protein LldF